MEDVEDYEDEHLEPVRRTRKDIVNHIKNLNETRPKSKRKNIIDNVISYWNNELIKEFD